MRRPGQSPKTSRRTLRGSGIANLAITLKEQLDASHFVMRQQLQTDRYCHFFLPTRQPPNIWNFWLVIKITGKMTQSHCSDLIWVRSCYGTGCLSCAPWPSHCALQAVAHQIAPGQLAEAWDYFAFLLINRLSTASDQQQMINSKWSTAIKWQKIFSIDFLGRGNCFCTNSKYVCATLVIGWRRKNEKGLLVTIDQKVKV